MAVNYQCICGKTFKSSSALGAHQYYKHPELRKQQTYQAQTQITKPIQPTIVVPTTAQEPTTLTSREIEIEVTPISRPLRLNAIVLLYFDYFRSKGYDGDLGEFITDCVVHYLSERGLKLGFFREAE